METLNNISQPVIIKTLVDACSQDPSVLKTAEARLKAWETLPGFYTAIATAFMSHETDANIRWIAALYFKNGIDKYWRKNAPNAISEEEKAALKQHLISRFNEPLLQIATQISVLIGKIARLDCPRWWPELIPVLVQSVQNNDPIHQHRSMLTLYHVVKSLASKRLPGDKKVFEELTSSIFGFLFNLWKQNFEEFLVFVNSRQADNLVNSLSRCILVLKILKKLAVYGFQDIRQSELAMEFVDLVFHRLDCFLQAKTVLQQFGSNELISFREKIILLLSKVLLEVSNSHEEGFGRFVQSSLQLVVIYCFTEDRKDLIFERFAINSLNLMKQILLCDKYKPAKSSEDAKSFAAIEVNKTMVEFFTRDVLTELCKHLVLHYFILTSEELSCWDSDPESFISEESGDSWMFSLRPCTESLFLILIKDFKEVICPVVLDLIQQYESCNDVNNPVQLLRKDAVYNAVGIASYDLYELINFEDWFTNKLLLDLQNQSPNYRIIRRRIIWLIGNWVGVRLKPELRPKLYEVIQSLMDRSEDLVIRLEAASALKATIDDAEFHSDQFIPYLEAHFNLLFNLLKDVSQCETKMAVLHVMTLMIERMEEDIRPYTSSLIHYLPLLWEASENHNLLRCAIITNLTHVVQGLGNDSVNMHGFLIPVIQTSTDVKQDQHIYLWEDALTLWLRTLHSCPRLTPQLLQLFDNLIPLLENGTEAMKIAFKIIEAYILLDSDMFLQKYHTALNSALTSLLSEVKSEGEIIILKLISLMLKVCPKSALSIFAHIFIDSIKYIINFNGAPVNPCPSLDCMHIVLISRIIIFSHEAFFQLVNDLAVRTSSDPANLLDVIIKGWLNKFNCIYQPEMKKLSILAFLSLISTNHKSVMSNLCSILGKTVDTLHEICRAESETGILVDSCVMTSDADRSMLESDDEGVSEEFEKKNVEIFLGDPVYSMSLLDYTASQVQLLQRNGLYLESLDVDISKQLNHYLSRHYRPSHQ